jgi:cysteinyl-tRNA synthetase
MPIFIYNSLTRKKEEFIPLNPPQVNIYTCGVTVYDESHIGHARSLYIFDVIRRYLEYRGFKVNFVRNITDIDDKIINRAQELKIDWQELIKKYIDRYYEDLGILSIRKGDSEPRATENIPDMIKHIQGLIKKGYAYESGGNVYFNVRKFPEYGRLSGQSIDSMYQGTRIETAEDKLDPLDFALWKKSKENEPAWDSPWGKGRPGWHIECSVMSQKFLKKDTLDIHAGGRDLIFPHHENEIAQAEALTGKPFAKYWLHHGLLTINGQKMAKSLVNFVTIKDFIERYKDVNILKLFFLSAHYAHPIDYNEEKIEEVKRAYERIDILMRKLDRTFGVRDLSKVITAGTEFIKLFKDKFIEYMDDDFNMPKALSILFDMVNGCNKLLNSDDELKNFKLRYAMEVMKEIFEIFGLTFIHKGLKEISDIEVINAIALRERLRKEKKYVEADKIRNTLEEKGIILEDINDGKTTWRRKL